MSQLNVSALPDYVETKRDELITKSALGAKTLDYVEIMPDVKYQSDLNYLDSTIEFGDGAECGFDPKGSDVFSKRSITVSPIKVEKQWCAKDMRKKYMNHQLMFEAGRETLPFEEKIVNANLDAINEGLEDVIWNGDSSLGLDGFVAQISGETLAVKVSVASGSTATEIIAAAVAKIPARALKGNVNIFVSYTTFRNYVAEQNASCCANRPIIDANQESMKYAGDSRISIVPVYGLENAAALAVAAPKEALVYGTDVEGSENAFELWYDKKDEAFDFRVLFNAGTAIKRPDLVVMITEGEE